VDFAALLARLEGVRRTAGGAMARCPAHEDQHASLSLSPNDDRILVHCHRGCPTEQVVSALGLELADLYFSPRARQNGTNLHTRLTLAEFAAAKKLPADFLTRHGVVEGKGGLIFHYRLMDGQPAPRQRIRLALTGERRFLWSAGADRPVPYGLWHLPGWRKDHVTDLYLVEGESDALTCWYYGLATLGVPGADCPRLLAPPHVAGFLRIFIVREADQGGKTFATGCIGRLAELGFDGAVHILDMAGGGGAKDLSELHVRATDAAGFAQNWETLVGAAERIKLPVAGLEVTLDSEIEPETVKWLWPGRIPLGKLTLMVGSPGLGKSFLSLDIVARLSSGKTWPDGAANETRGQAIVFSAEDDPADTLRPRLIAQDATEGNTLVAGLVRELDDNGETRRRGFSLARDLPHLERLLDRHPGAKLIVIDPLVAYMPRTDAHRDAEVRSDVLGPLADLATRHGAAVIGIQHLNKNSNAQGLDRIGGSVAFPAAARAVWGITMDPDDPNRRLFVSAKNNLGPRVPGLAFRLAPSEQGTVCLQWIAGEVNKTLTDVFEAENEARQDGGGRKLDRAKELWRELLADGPRELSEIEDAMRSSGISAATTKRARWELGVKTRKKGFAGGWVASL
jgi:hypothetical protein